MTLRQILSLIARVAVGGVLIYSGASKALAPTAEFAGALAAYKILPHEIIPLIAQFWPWMELLIGTYVFFGYFTQTFAWVAVGMFAIFLGVLGSALFRGIDPGSCGCFGIGLHMSLHKTMTLDTGLLALSLLLALVKLPISPVSADSWVNR